MHVRGIGLTTDLALIATRGRIVDRGHYLVARTPDDPGYYYGNLLVLPSAPPPGKLPALRALFAREVATDPAVQHETFVWDAPTDAIASRDELVAAGFELETTWVMTAAQLAPVPAPRGLELRPLAPDELPRAAELDFAISGGGHEGYRRFLHRRAAWQRELVLRRQAQFWGAFDAQTLVGSLGVVQLARLGRYQDVQTAPSHRRRGVASALLAAAGEAALASVDELVIKTLVDSDAARVYHRAGFRTVERTMSACRPPS